MFTENVEITATIVPDYETERNKPMPNLVHGLLQTQISHLLKMVYGNQFIFPNELSLNTMPVPSTPDICIYPKRKVDIKTVTAKQDMPPVTTIEILSPTQSVSELMHKAWDLYFPFGVQSAWIVVPEFRAIHILLPNDERYLFDKGVLMDPATGIQLDMIAVFEDLM